jgi:hypothetical protein
MTTITTKRNYGATGGIAGLIVFLNGTTEVYVTVISAGSNTTLAIRGP